MLAPQEASYDLGFSDDGFPCGPRMPDYPPVGGEPVYVEFETSKAGLAAGGSSSASAGNDANSSSEGRGGWSDRQLSSSVQLPPWGARPPPADHPPPVHPLQRWCASGVPTCSFADAALCPMRLAASALACPRSAACGTAHLWRCAPVSGAAQPWPPQHMAQRSLVSADGVQHTGVARLAAVPHAWRCTGAGGCFGDLGAGLAMQATLVQCGGRYAVAKAVLEEQRDHMSRTRFFSVRERREVLSRTVEALTAAAGRPPIPACEVEPVLCVGGAITSACPALCQSYQAVLPWPWGWGARPACRTQSQIEGLPATLSEPRAGPLHGPGCGQRVCPLASMCGGAALQALTPRRCWRWRTCSGREKSSPPSTRLCAPPPVCPVTHGLEGPWPAHAFPKSPCGLKIFEPSVLPVPRVRGWPAFVRWLRQICQPT